MSSPTAVGRPEHVHGQGRRTTRRSAAGGCQSGGEPFSGGAREQVGRVGREVARAWSTIDDIRLAGQGYHGLARGEECGDDRAALLRAGRQLFGDRGFDAVPADDVVAAAGVTRGALHHHFKDKRGLFRSVFEQLEAEIAEDLGHLLADGEGDLPRRSLSAFLDLCERSDVRRIALTDAPAVLGWKTWREIESEHGLGLLTEMLAEVRTADRTTPVHLLARFILSSVIEGALSIANAEDPTEERRQVETTLTTLFGHLLA